MGNIADSDIKWIASVMDADEGDITIKGKIKGGMTNSSWLFLCDGQEYIFRLPGEGSDYLVNRKHEKAVYDAIRGNGVCEDPVFFDETTGRKITRFLSEARVCNTDSESDLRLCMDRLHSFHKMKLQVDHSFDLVDSIEKYESYRASASIYEDYEEVKCRVFKAMKEFVPQNLETCLTHVDAVPDNFLILADDKVQLTDWEYAGMHDPHLDIAMFIIYSGFDKSSADHMMDLYEGMSMDHRTRYKIYAYMAGAGLLWSNWCEIKMHNGIHFGSYARKQYFYASEYSKRLLNIGGV